MKQFVGEYLCWGLGRGRRDGKVFRDKMGLARQYEWSRATSWMTVRGGLQEVTGKGSIDWFTLRFSTHSSTRDWRGLRQWKRQVLTTGLSGNFPIEPKSCNSQVRSLSHWVQRTLRLLTLVTTVLVWPSSFRKQFHSWYITCLLTVFLGMTSWCGLFHVFDMCFCKALTCDVVFLWFLVCWSLIPVGTFAYIALFSLQFRGWDL